MSLEQREPDSHFKGRCWRSRVATSAKRVGVGRRDAVRRRRGFAPIRARSDGKHASRAGHARLVRVRSCSECGQLLIFPTQQLTLGS